MEMEVDVNKTHLPDLGKEVCRSKGAPIGKAVDGLGDETRAYSLAFCKADSGVV